MEKLFGIYDKIRNNYLCLSTAPNSACFVRDYLQYVLKTVPLRDTCIYELGSVLSNGDIDFHNTKIDISWDCYKYPETKAENLAPLNATPQEIESAFNKKISEDK